MQPAPPHHSTKLKASTERNFLEMAPRIEVSLQRSNSDVEGLSSAAGDLSHANLDHHHQTAYGNHLLDLPEICNYCFGIGHDFPQQHSPAALPSQQA